MTRDQKLAIALANADRQLALVNDALAQAVEDARELLQTHDATAAWALLGTKIAAQLDCSSKYQQFAAEMVAAAAIQIALGS